MQLTCENDKARTLNLEKILEKPKQRILKRKMGKFEYQDVGILTLKEELGVQMHKKKPRQKYLEREFFLFFSS